MNPYSRLWFIPLLIMLLALLIIGVFVLPRYIAHVDARTGVYAYCQLTHPGFDCGQWSENVMSGYEREVMDCFYAHRYPEFEGSFNQCVREVGL